jgi:large subunit ribosomal protein L24
MSLNKMKLRKGDSVVVLTGKDKGKKGQITKVIPTERKVLVGGINVVKKHTKPSKMNPNGGIVSMEKPIASSNVAILDPKTDQPTRVGYKVLADGKKVRFAKKSGEIIDNVK